MGRVGKAYGCKGPVYVINPRNKRFNLIYLFFVRTTFIQGVRLKLRFAVF